MIPKGMTSVLEKGGTFFFDGDWHPAHGNVLFDVITPSTEEVFGRVALADVADVDRIVKSARFAFDRGPWSRLQPSDRAVFLKKLADALDRRAAEASHIWTSETGATVGLAQYLPQSVSAFFRYYADLAADYPFVEEHESSVGNIGLLVREPVGVVAAILPWNGPLSLIAIKVAPALLAGCTVIIKMSPEAPFAGHLFAEAAVEAGIPPGVINILTADRDVSEALVRHPGVDKVTFTGSTAAGRRIGSVCGGRIARCTLELGGKSAALILDDYDVETAAKSLSQTGSRLTGQICATMTRIIVSKDRHSRLVAALASEFSKTRVGDPFDPQSEMGPLAMARQRDRVEGYIAKGRAEGAVLAAGGGRPAHLERGYYIEPTVFADVENDMTIAREEIFGPVLSVIKANDERHAIEIANDSIYGLNASVFTDDEDRAFRVARELRSGTVGHNAQRVDFAIAFGGFKQSGLGREGGREGLLPFLESKTIILDKKPRGVGSAS